MEVMAQRRCFAIFSSWLSSELSRRQICPASVQMIDSSADTEVMQVNVQSESEPSKQFRPGNVIGPGLGIFSGSEFRDRVGLKGGGLESRTTLHILTCLVPTVTSEVPHQVISQMFEVHLFAECKRTAPVFELTAQKKRKPSLISPKVARYRESGLNATHRTPNECSDMMDKGKSAASSTVEKIRTLGL